MAGLRLRELQWTYYRLELRGPLRVGGWILRHREGLLLRLGDEAGARGYGECAPLPGLHAESLERVRAQLVDWAELLPLDLESPPRRDPGSPAVPPLFESLDEELPGYGGLAPSLRWALGSALLNLCAEGSGRTPADLLCPGAARRLRVNALFDGDEADLQAFVQAAPPGGWSAVKVKVGRRDPRTEIRTLRSLRSELGDSLELRLDANRSLAFENAVELAREARLCGVRWIEEPLADPARLQEFHQRTGLPVALDESLLDPALRGLWREPLVAAWIVKPALRGLPETLRLLRQVPPGTAAVVSSVFESGLGLWNLARIAACAAGEEHGAPATGLGTDRFLAEDLADPPYSSSSGVLVLPRRPVRPSAEFLAGARWRGTATAESAEEIHR